MRDPILIWLKGLSLICTNPKYLRRGAAKAMIASMLDLADAQGIKAYLEATPAGKPIYEKLGFREVDSLEWDLGKLTNNLDGVYKLTIMIREPKPHRHLGVEHSTISHS